MNQTSDYDYDLPQSLIAQQPLPNRVDARLLVAHRNKQELDHFHIRDLPEILRDGDLLVLNNTRVVPARLVGYRSATNGRWEGLFLDSDEQGNWKILGKTRGKIQPGESVTLEDRDGHPRCTLRLVTRLEGGQWAARPGTDRPAFEVLTEIGRVPLPPYIRGGQMVKQDLQDYQTVFAQHPGSVAAPTAGLHFTDDLLKKLEAKGVRTAHVTLHVGMGTFRPVSSESLDEHTMHSEWGEITEPTVARIEQTRQAGGRVIAVGTTSVRVLESSVAANGGEIRPWQGETDLFIKPPYQFRAIDGLLTNFHLPKSTLLVLVRTLGGHELIKRAYQVAVEEEYRFFSYGDAMLIL